MSNKEIIKILRNPPRRSVFCSWCGGKGFHITGAISTDTCNRCGGDGNVMVQNFNATATKIKKIILADKGAKK